MNKILGIVIVVLLLGAGCQPRFKVFVDFKTSQGLAKGSPITLKGVPIGKVAKLTILGNGVRVECRIKTEHQAALRSYSAFYVDTVTGKPELQVVVIDPTSPPTVTDQVFVGSETKVDLVATNSVNMKMILIPGGTFIMGSPPEEPCRQDDEGPQHQVTVAEFYLAETETTRAQFAQFINATGYKTSAEQYKSSDTWKSPGFTQPDDAPVVRVSWDDTIEFCNWLSEKEGRQKCYLRSSDSVECYFSNNGYRLPTEAEWEYACRAKTTTIFYSGNDLSDCEFETSKSQALERVGWYKQNSNAQPHPVKGKEPNTFGLYDMHGNVWEWCQDYYGAYTEFSQANPTGPTSGDYRVLRGGGWASSASSCRAANRGRDRSRLRGSFLGFRVAAPARRTGV